MSTNHLFLSYLSTFHYVFVKVMKFDDFKELGSEAAVKVGDSVCYV